MRRRAPFLIALVLLALYVPAWWVLVFTGRYDAALSPDMLRNTKEFLPSDLVLFALLIGAIAGIRRGALWGRACGWMVAGAMIYVSVHAGVGIVTGLLPGDAAMQLIVWPYLAAGAIGAWWLLQEKGKPPERRGAEPPARGARGGRPPADDLDPDTVHAE